MKIKMIPLVLLLCLLSCHNNREILAETEFKVSTLTSDVLIQKTAAIPFSNPNKTAIATLSVSGKSILNGTATFKVVNEIGEELHCETFPAKKLIQPEYKIANSVLQEINIREVVDAYFVNSATFKPGDSLPYVSL
ncbi:hypothetical protein [Maribacter sp. R77961]|uniref:hypothetical protein n=1 Tax=Maribacter sp. R77961 TaxID=3093871 RepID=UPI0037CC1756